MKRNRPKLTAALLTLVLMIGLVAECGRWLRAQQRQYALNRALIAALLKEDDGQALALVNAGADPNARFKPMSDPSLPELVRQLFHRSMAPANSSPTALMIACGAYWDREIRTYNMQKDGPDNAPLIQAMALHGANNNMKDEVGTTPLDWSVGHNRPKTTTVLLEHGARVNERGSDGATVLMLAVWIPNGKGPISLEMVQLLLKYGANLNVQDKHGQTALSAAVRDGADKEVIYELLAHGADPNLTDKEGVTPLMLAEHTDPLRELPKRPDLVALLKQYGAKDKQ